MFLAAPPPQQLPFKLTPDQAKMIGITIFALSIAILVFTFVFFLTLQIALARCAPRNRRMEPLQVWWNLLPCISLYWQAFTVVKISQSLRLEYESRGIPVGSDFGIVSGCMAIFTTYAAIVFSWLTRWDGRLAAAGVILGFYALSWLCLFVYWLQVLIGSSRLKRRPPKPRDPDEIYELEVDPYARFRPPPPTGGLS